MRARGVRGMAVLCALGITCISLVPAGVRADDTSMLANLIPSSPISPFIDSSLVVADHPGAIRFGTLIYNVGLYAFELTALVEDLAWYPSRPKATSYQCVRWVTVRACDPAGRHVVGAVSFDLDHSFWHFGDFLRHELRRLGADGTPDMSPTGFVAGGDVLFHCLMDTNSFEGRTVQLPGFYTACQSGRQGLSPGYWNLVESDFDFQQIRIVDLQGTPLVEDQVPYAVVTTLNPIGRYYEQTRQDNMAYTLVRFSSGARTLEEVPRND